MEVVRARLRLYGPLSDVAISAPLEAGPEVGPAGRWIVTEGPHEPLERLHRIQRLELADAHTAAALRYDIMGWAVLAPAPGTILYDEQYSLNLRQGLVHHFYLTGTPVLSDELGQLLVDLRRVKSRVDRALKDLGLHAQQGSLFLGYEGDQATRDALTAPFIRDDLVVAGSRARDGGHVLAVEMGGCRLLVTVVTDQVPTDDLAWYREWLAAEGMRAVLKHGNETAVEVPNALSQYALATSRQNRGARKVDALLEARTALLDLDDRAHELRLMARTARAYRANIGTDHLDRLRPQTVAASVPLLQDHYRREYDRMLDEPVSVLEDGLDRLIRQTELRVRTLSEVIIARYNTNVQARLSRLQWLVVVLAVLTLVVAYLTYLAAD
jgi:hypothetical protein